MRAGWRCESSPIGPWAQADSGRVVSGGAGVAPGLGEGLRLGLPVDETV